MQDLQDAIGLWSDATFGEGDRYLGILEKLKEEVQELLDDPMNDDEMADCFIILLDAARKRGMYINDILAVCYDKLEVCKKRKWGPVDKNGKCQHIEE